MEFPTLSDRKRELKEWLNLPGASGNIPADAMSLIDQGILKSLGAKRYRCHGPTWWAIDESKKTVTIGSDQLCLSV